MALYHNSGVSVESWVEVAEDVSVECEVDTYSEHATLIFGRCEYALCLPTDGLRRFAALATDAVAELDAARA